MYRGDLKFDTELEDKSIKWDIVAQLRYAERK